MALISALLLSSRKRSRIYLYQEAQGELGGVTDFPKCFQKKKRKKERKKTRNICQNSIISLDTCSRVE